ncbi:MAG: ATP synthase F1 subunit epsilon [Solirubrobacterales bacterium]|nr:ATP synthase F1 subunit epsilon [Solirubrobacterales bacterium]
MARTPFRVEVLTPEGSVFDEEVGMVSTRTEIGSIGILARHQPLLGTLMPTELRLYRSETDVVRYAQGEGYVQVSADGVLVLVEEAHPPDELDVADLKDKLSEAESGLSAAEDDSEEQKRCSRDKRRWETFIRIAEGDSPS